MERSEALVYLLERQAALYSMGEHSSLPAEMVEELLRSISFTLERCGREGGLTSGDLERQFQRGQALLEEDAARGRQLLDAAEETAPPYRSISYRDTLRELRGFFRAYDVRFFAHQVPCMIDYQLCHPLEEAAYGGISYIQEYLRRLLLENEFCLRFSPDRARLLLSAACPSYRIEISGLYEPIAVHALGLSLAEGEIGALHVSRRQRRRLEEILCREPEALERSALRLGRTLELSAPGAAYLLQTARALRPRVRAALESGGLEHIFFETE